MPIALGAIADDYTGASDLASVLVEQGMKVAQVLGVPEADLDPADIDAIVVALKSRTAPVDQAVDQSLAALSWLKAQGAEQIIFKYCSTFDSTSSGNIGPIADALCDRLAVQIAIVCPAFPDNGRTVIHGHLFVHGTPLAESSMKDHPLTPMRDSNLMRLMDTQSAHRSGLVDLNSVRAGPEAIRERLGAIVAEGKRYAIVDALNNQDLTNIGKAVEDAPLVTGGSAVALQLPENYRRNGKIAPAESQQMPEARGRIAILAGSCSQATRGQLERARQHWPIRQLNIDALANGEDEAGAVVDWALSQAEDAPVILYASAHPEEVKRNQEKYGVARTGELIEACFAELARQLNAQGFDRFVVAGGETSGAVVAGFEAKMLRICRQIAPGVPWTETVGAPAIALALKSGNFGDEDFFITAVSMFNE